MEDCFAYLTRHTVGRPRDFVRLCAALSSNGQSATEKQFKRTVNQIAADDVVSTLFEELAMFLECLKSPQERAIFFGLIPYNILNKQEIRTIANQFNGTDALTGDIYNPFMELWSCGLLGVVDDAIVEDSPVQRFKLPHESFRFDSRLIPDSPYYLIHPSLNMRIKNERNSDYRVFKYVVIGNTYPWQPYDPIMVDLQRETHKISANKELKMTINDLLPFLHASLAAKKDLTQILPSNMKQKLSTIASGCSDSKYEPFWQAWKCACSEWGSTDTNLSANRLPIPMPKRSAQL